MLELVSWCLLPVFGAMGIAVGWWFRSLAQERREFDAQVARHEAILAERRAPRHAAPWEGGHLDAGRAIAQHAETGAATGVQRSTDRSPRVGTQFPPARPARPPRGATTAADIAPVILPGEPPLTDTGELRALTARADEWIENMRREDAAWRQEAGFTP